MLFAESSQLKAIATNGPAVVLVNVAERPEAVCRISRFHQNANKAVGSEAWHVFLPSWYKFDCVKA